MISLPIQPHIPSPLDLPDIWIAKSVLHKAIRRDEADLAARAALALYGMDPMALWLRLMVIAFEDIGLGSLEAVQIATAATGARWRKARGGDILLAVAVARLLAESPKCRATEGLAGAAANHPSLDHCRRLMPGLSIAERLVMVRDQGLTLADRTVAAWFSSGVDHWRNHRVGPGNLPALMAAYRDIGIPEPILETTTAAIRKTKEPIFVVLPLLVSAADSGEADHRPLPPMPMVGDLPLPALDMFTRIGKKAISTFAGANPAVSKILEDCLPRRLWRAATGFAVFYMEGGLVTPKHIWRYGSEIERLGIEADFATVGMPMDAIPELLHVVGAELDHLNTIRADLLREM